MSDRLRSTLLIAAASCACGAPDLEVRGRLDRLVGDKVVLELVQGDPGLSGDVRLFDARGRTFAEQDLGVQRDSERSLSLRIPTGITVGPARITIGGGDSGPTYGLSLQLSRMAVAMDAQGKLQALPLPGSSAPKLDASAGTTGGAVALAPAGDVAIALSGKEVSAFRMGEKLAPAAAGVTVDNATSLAALDGGAVIGTDGTVVVLRFADTGTEQQTFAIPRVRAVASDLIGKRAAVLHHCDDNNDTIADADCVTLIELGGPSATLGQRIKVDDTPNASVVALRADGTALVVADPGRIYGLVLQGASVLRSDLSWEQPKLAEPIAIDRAPSNLGDIFAMADAGNNAIKTVGFQTTAQETKLQPVETPISLPARPTAIGFGRATELYVAVGNGLLLINYGTSLEPTNIGVTTAEPIVSLAVQR